jgi:hypothetical protein
MPVFHWEHCLEERHQTKGGGLVGLENRAMEYIQDLVLLDVMREKKYALNSNGTRQIRTAVTSSRWAGGTFRP